MDTGNDVFVWVGKEASVEERKNGMSIAHVSKEKYIVVLLDENKCGSFCLLNTG